MFVDFGEFGADGKVHGVVVFVDVYKGGIKYGLVVVKLCCI